VAGFFILLSIAAFAAAGGEHIMNQINRDLGSSHQGLPSNLSANVIYCIIVFSTLTFGCSKALAVFATERPSVYSVAVIGQPAGESPSSSAETNHDEGPSQDRQDQPKNKEQQPSQPDITTMMRTLKLGAEIFQLSASQTRKGAIGAIKKSEEAFAIYKKMDLKVGMAASLFACGGAHLFLGQNREALSAFLEASDYSKESGSDFLRPFLEASIGEAYWNLGETSKALERLDRALPLVRSLNNATMLAQTLKALGEIHVQGGQKRKALEYLKEARALYHQVDNWQFEILELALISALDSSLGLSTEAFEAARVAIDRAKEKSDPAWEAQGHLAMGAAYAAVGNSGPAIAEYNLVLQTSVAQHDASLEATTLNNLGLLYAAQGEFDAAFDYFTRSLKLSRSVSEPKSAGYALNNIGTIYYRRGEPLKALRHFEEALAIADRVPDKRLKAAVLSSMADVYFLINSREYAVNVLKETAATFKEIEEPVHESEALISLADVFATTGRFQEALDLLSASLESRRIAEDPSRQGYILREMGSIYSLMGDTSKALAHFAEAVAKLEAAGDEVGRVELYAAMGALAASSADYEKAEELLTRALGLARTAGLRQSESLILTALASANEKQGRLTQAETFYDQAIAVGESLRSSARIEELKSGVGDISAALLSPAILLKIKLGKWPEAFALTERARARTFLDQMNNVHIDVRKGGDPELTNQEQSLRFEMNSLEEKLRKERQENSRSEAAAVMAASLREKEQHYSAVLIRLKASNPNYAELQGYSPKPLNEIQRLLEPQTTLVSYFVTAEKTLAFVVSSDSFQAVEIPVKETDLRAAIEWFRGFASLRDPQSQSLKQLHDWLIAPIRQYLKTAELVIVPHGILHYVPFAALTDGKRYFGDDHAISYLPSASILQSIRRRAAPIGRRILAVSQSRAEGKPVLSYADKEAAGVAKLYHTQSLPTGRATRAEFMKRAPAYRTIHLAAHAELNTNSPLFSRLLLSPDSGDSGAIEVREVYGMDLARTDLVVLSACQTQLGEQSKGDDIVGLNRAFIYAGASSVIASLWTVDDEATSLLMKAFYGHLKHGMSKAAALQAAQAATRKKYPHPYYWAAFALTGVPGKDSGRRLTNAHLVPHGARRFQ
jgi:CHAT domain-containing protein/tetratricopeptide (TPR) repeat protein